MQSAAYRASDFDGAVVLAGSLARHRPFPTAPGPRTCGTIFCSDRAARLAALIANRRVSQTAYCAGLALFSRVPLAVFLPLQALLNMKLFMIYHDAGLSPAK